jgi:hypothetical protein
VPVYEVNLGALSRDSIPPIGTALARRQALFFEITAEQPNYSTTNWTKFYDSGGIGISTLARMWCAHKQPLFGLIYAPNTGAPSKGITVFAPAGDFNVAADVTAGGTVDWGGGTQTMLDGLFDEDERFVSAIPFGEVRRLNADNSITAVVTGVLNPKGLTCW